jgi:hypothetical protein
VRNGIKNEVMWIGLLFDAVLHHRRPADHQGLVPNDTSATGGHRGVPNKSIPIYNPTWTPANDLRLLEGRAGFIAGFGRQTRAAAAVSLDRR